MAINIFNRNNAGVSFNPAKTDIPLCGFLQNQYSVLANLIQAVVRTDGLLSAMPVTIINDSTPTSGPYAGEEINPLPFVITGVSTAVTNIDGFVLETVSDYIPENGGASIPVIGSFVQIAKIGSGLKMYLPCDNTLRGVALGSKIDYDFTTNTLKLGTTTSVPGLTLASGVVNGKVKKINTTTGVAEWVNTLCVLVQLN